MKFFRVEFDLQLKFHRFCYKKGYHINIIMKYSEFVFFIMSVLFFVTNLSFFLYLDIISSIVILASSILLNVNTVFTSLRKFIGYGFFSCLILTTIFYYFLYDSLRSNDYRNNDIISYITFTISMLLAWAIICYVANNKVATLTNLIFSTITGILILIKDVFIKLLPSNYNINQLPQAAIEAGYTYVQLIEELINIILMPILISNLIVVLLCAIKGYWIEKYNNDTDITMDLIKQEENSEDT